MTQLFHSNYELHATVSHITDPATDSQDGLVAHINVAEPYHKRKEVFIYNNK